MTPGSLLDPPLLAHWPGGIYRSQQCGRCRPAGVAGTKKTGLVAAFTCTAWIRVVAGEAINNVCSEWCYLSYLHAVNGRASSLSPVFAVLVH